MKEITETIQPYSAADGEYASIVEFAIKAASLLDSSFNPTNIWSERNTERVPDERDTIHFSYGEEPSKIHIQYNIGYESQGQVHAQDDVSVSCRGLPDGMSLELRVLRSYNDPRYIQLHIAGPEHAVDAIHEGFKHRFEVEYIPAERGIDYLLRTTKSAVNIEAWRVVEFNSHQILKSEPNNSDALMYLGIARAAQGFEPEGENLLLSSLTLNPKNVDAYYNLGIITLNQGRCQLASDAFRHGLSIDPNNHSLLFQLGKTLEKLGSIEDALEMYSQSLRNSPNPEQAWRLIGMDFTTDARDSIRRIESLLNT